MTLRHAVFLDLDPLDQQDLDLSALHNAFTQLTLHQHSAPEQINERLQQADVAIVNKAVLDEAVLNACPDLKLVLVTATGVNNIDLAAAKRLGIAVYNCQAYGTATVAQHTMALLLSMATRLTDYLKAVNNGEWQHSPNFCLLDFPIIELEGKTLGIVGFGELGSAVGRLAEAFGMRVLVAQIPGRTQVEGRLPLEQLLPQVDALTLHCPLTEHTHNLIGEAELRRMKPNAFIINTARGGLIDEHALAKVLRSGHLGGAATDVLTVEPPTQGNPLLAHDIPRLLITPHSAWGSREARQRIVQQTAENARLFYENSSTRRVI